MSMVERVAYNVIRSGIDTLTEDPDLIVELFECEMELSREESEEIRDLFLEKPPNLIHGYARSDSDFPLFAVTLGGLSNGTNFIGDEGGVVLDGPDRGTDEWATVFGYTINVLVYAQHPDVCLYYWHILLALMVLGDDTFKNYGLFDINYSGNDMTPDPAWVPAGLFLRRFTLTASRQYAQSLKSTRIGKAWAVAGLHVSTAGAPGEDIGGVKAFVDPISPELLGSEDEDG